MSGTDIVKLDHTVAIMYWNIYISQKIRLCKGDLVGQFQTIAVPMSWNIWVVIWCKNMTSWFQPLWNSSNSMQKAVD